MNGGPGSGNPNPGQGRGVGKPAGGGGSFKWTNGEKFGTDSFKTHLENTAKEVEKEYGVPLDRVTITTRDSLLRFAGVDANKVDAYSCIKGKMNTLIAFNDYMVNEKPEAAYTNYKNYVTTEVTRSDGIGVIRHEFGHSIIAELARQVVLNSKAYKEGTINNSDEAIKTAYTNINTALYAIGLAEMNKQRYSEKTQAMSSYGLSADYEFVAESISNPDYSEVTKKFQSLLKKLQRKFKRTLMMMFKII